MIVTSKEDGQEYSIDRKDDIKILDTNGKFTGITLKFGDEILLTYEKERPARIYPEPISFPKKIRLLHKK